MDKQNNENQHEITFKSYFDSIANEEHKVAIVSEMVPKYMSISSFYRKKNHRKFTELEFEKLEQFTNQKFTR